MIGIYKITNKLNGKSYIGQSIDIKRRWKQHKKTTPQKNKNQLYQDFYMCGIENFNFEILEECDIKELDEREIYWINKFDTFYNGYNLTQGGKISLYPTQSSVKSTYSLLYNDMVLYKNISFKCWKVYYYLFLISKKDLDCIRKDNFVYKKNINITKFCKDFGIKSNQTFYNALNKLEKNNLISIEGDTYYIYTEDWMQIDKHILLNLLLYAKVKEQDIDLLRTFLILKKMNKVAENSEEKSFTLRQISILLGHGDTHSKYYENIRIYLALLSFWGLIELKQHKEFNKNLGKAYTIFHLQNIKECELNADFESDIEAEMNAALPSEELMNKLRFSFPNIIENKEN